MPDIRASSLITTFVGPDENPLSVGGQFSRASNIWTDMMRQGNAATNDFTGTLGFSYWNPISFNAATDAVEVWGLATGGGGGAGGEGWRLGFLKDVGMGGGVDGYVAIHFSAGSPIIIIRRYDNGGFTALAAVGVGFIGGYFLFKINGNDLEFWYSGDTINWSLVVSTTDTTYRTGLYLALGAEDQGFGHICGWNLFGGGQESALPQIYRRPNE
jgi:hypothetical protein